MMQVVDTATTFLIEKMVLKAVKVTPWWAVVVPYLVVAASISHMATSWTWLGLFYVLFLFMVIYWALRLAIARLDIAEAKLSVLKEIGWKNMK